MTDFDLYLEQDEGTVAISITALTDGVQDDATDVAALLTEEYGEDLRGR